MRPEPRPACNAPPVPAATASEHRRRAGVRRTHWPRPEAGNRTQPLHPRPATADARSTTLTGAGGAMQSSQLPPRAVGRESVRLRSSRARFPAARVPPPYSSLVRVESSTAAQRGDLHGRRRGRVSQRRVVHAGRMWARTVMIADRPLELLRLSSTCSSREEIAE